MATSGPSFDEAVRTLPSQGGQTLAQLSAERPVLVVFLRHTGCAFCREALSDLQKQRSGIESRGTSIALVHMKCAKICGDTSGNYHPHACDFSKSDVDNPLP